MDSKVVLEVAMLFIPALLQDYTGIFSLFYFGSNLRKGCFTLERKIKKEFY